ncbi:hypothetical protein SERLA73DRAFT_185988 [Serpula lacrymans var. lacrymans S7.3]|uniref:Uncharacterized protein n=2 Tax=Serpula lacrymans var. lacrymans TaxID=341189 RepID=F8Q6R4_SERL3|nr:uncharacterized protein SERLADRAFT_474798 [Serpula lacrymans var. lacrymans S7.9]EGN96302.1 hypothetical protein SERLA73DRAFT_185988 [Serpula lacrymans var. lacrymans S7.3]EGO21836.1 hypothetical protein SERLADRAFT_474798 [Serpula lacrymans var. lacrymans S7.9]
MRHMYFPSSAAVDGVELGTHQNHRFNGPIKQLLSNLQRRSLNSRGKFTVANLLPPCFHSH